MNWDQYYLYALYYKRVLGDRTPVMSVRVLRKCTDACDRSKLFEEVIVRYEDSTINYLTLSALHSNRSNQQKIEKPTKHVKEKNNGKNDE